MFPAPRCTRRDANPAPVITWYKLDLLIPQCPEQKSPRRVYIATGEIDIFTGLARGPTESWRMPG